MSWRRVAGGVLIVASAIGCEAGALTGAQSGRGGSGGAVTGIGGVAGAGFDGRDCPCSRRPDENNSSLCPPGTGKVTTAEIGPAGGTVLLDGTPQTKGVSFKLEIPFNGLAEVVTIQVTEMMSPVPQPYVDQSPIYDLQPAGLTFATPVLLTIPYQNVRGIIPPETSAYLSTPDGASFERLEDAYVNAGFVTAPLSRLGQVFAGHPRGKNDIFACGLGTE